MTCSSCKLKVKFFSLTNIHGSLYAKFDVISPKKVLCEDTVIDLTKLGGYSKSLKYGLFVGNEFVSNKHIKKKDSLFTPKNATRHWLNGHDGYFSLSDTLFVDDSIRKVLGVDGDWDGEWDRDDILDTLTDKQIQCRVEEYLNDPWVKYYPIMEKLWTKLADIDTFVQQCEEQSIPKDTYSYYIKNKQEYCCTDCKTEVSTTWCRLTNPKDLNENRSVCFECSRKYKPLYIHPYNANASTAYSGCLGMTSDVLITEHDIRKHDDELAIHVCADLECSHDEYVWVTKKCKTQNVEIDNKVYPLYT